MKIKSESQNKESYVYSHASIKYKCKGAKLK